MAWQYCFKSKCDALWSILVGITFLCCSLIIYHSFIYYGQTCTLTTDCSVSTVKAAGLSNEKCNSFCTTENCVEIANTIMDYMNLSADPCEDFYNFACGNYHEQLGREGNYSVFDTRKEFLYRILKDNIETSKETQFPRSAASKLKIVYDSCMDINSSELISIQSLQSFIQLIGIKNWPNLKSNFTFSKPTLENILGRLVSFEEDIFVRFFTTERKIYYPEWTGGLSNMSVGIPLHNECNCDEEDLEYLINDILRYAGMNHKDRKDIWRLFRDVHNGIAELKRNNNVENAVCDDGNEDSFEPLDCIRENGQNKSMVCKILDSVVRYGRLQFTFTTENLNVPCIFAPYVHGLSNFLNRYDHRTIAHYIALRVFLNNLKYTTFSFRKKVMSFLDQSDPELLFGQDSYLLEIDRWKFCVAWTSKYMKMPLGLIYVAEMWPQEAVEELDRIVYEYQSATSKFIYAQNSISEEARNLAAREVENGKNAIAEMFKMLRNRTMVNNNYKRFHPVRKNFILNVMYNKKRHFISKYLDARIEAIMDIHNALFVVSASAAEDVYLMFGILQPPIFKYGYPKLFNIAKIGQTIGHEIGHSYTLVLWDNFRGDEHIVNYIKDNLKCREEQYFKFILKSIGRNVRANQTQGEDVSDSMAIQVSEKVAEELIRDMSERTFALPGLNFSAEELFYISYAQTWCAVSSIKKEWQNWERDHHSPPEFRVKGPLQTSQRFSEVFNCSTATFMNPSHKCPVFY